jgi:hypothetical protein
LFYNGVSSGGAQSDDCVRDYSKPKIDWNRVFSSSGLFYHCFYVTFYFTNPDGFVLNFKPVPFVILIGTLLIPIQTSTEDIFLGYLMQGFGFSETQMVPALMTSIMVGCFGNRKFQN